MKWVKAGSGVIDAKWLGSPFVLLEDRVEESGFHGEQADAQRKLEEAALLARWSRKHKPPIAKVDEDEVRQGDVFQGGRGGFY